MMKAEIVMDPDSKSGILKITPETPIEVYTLYHWWHNFNMGDYGSIIAANYDSPVLLPQVGDNPSTIATQL
jgi:hypothetical protein